MTATDSLRHEHDIILYVLEAARNEGRLIQDDSRIDRVKIDQIIDFCRNFIDACHHGKEENYLFIKLQERGLPRESGPLAVMFMEHAEGRRRLQTLATNLAQTEPGETLAREKIAGDIFGYVDLLRQHIAKENTILFPMADKLLSTADHQELLTGFEAHESKVMGPGVHEKYHQLAHELGKG